MTTTIESPRLFLRPFEVGDAEAAHAWFSDPEVMRFIPRGRDFTLADTQRRITGYRARQAEFGFSKWLVLLRETQHPIGDSGLMHLPDGERVELGFRFAAPAAMYDALRGRRIMALCASHCQTVLGCGVRVGGWARLD